MGRQEPEMLGLIYAIVVFGSSIGFTYILWFVIIKISKALQIVIPLLGAAVVFGMVAEVSGRHSVELVVPIGIGFGLSFLMLFFKLHAEMNDLQKEISNLKSSKHDRPSNDE